MPMYQFACAECAVTKESIQKFNDPPPECEKCNQPMKREIASGNTTFAFKGKGFYATDYKGKR